MTDDKKIKTCACGCGKKLDMVGSGNRKFWYGHDKIGKDNFWFYLNHPPDCLCGCGEQTEWDEADLLWKEFRNRHDSRLIEADIRKLRRKRKRRSTHQLDLFPLKDKKTRRKGK